MEALTPAQIDLRERAARFVDETLIPLELEAERNGGPLPPEKATSVSTRARELGLVGGNHAVDVGGQGWSAFEQVLVQEELGRNTNGVWWNMGGGYNVLARGTPEQIERYLKPTLRGERADSYAVTEGGAGSDAGGIAGTAERTAAGWRIRAEKWFVTSGDVSDFDIVMVNVVDGDERLPTLFLVDRDRPGIEVIDDPPFTHSFPHGHPTLRYDCEVDADAVLGGDEMIGRGNDLQNEWFIEERIHIAARCVGAMRRLLAEAVEWAAGREQFGGADLRLPGRELPARRLRGRLRGRPPPHPRRRPLRRTPAPTRSSSTAGRRWPSSSRRRRRGAAPTAACRCTAGAATCARQRPSGSCASCASTGSGRAPPRSSG